MATRAVPLHKSGRTIPSEINGYAHFRLAYERPRTNGPTLSKAPELSRPHRRASFLRIGHDADNPRKVKRSSPRQLPTFPNSCAEPLGLSAGIRGGLRRAARVIQQCSAEVTHSENGTEIGNEMRTAIIRAEGVLLGGREGQAISSTPKACGARFHYPRRRRAWCR